MDRTRKDIELDEENHCIMSDVWHSHELRKHLHPISRPLDVPEFPYIRLPRNLEEYKEAQNQVES